MRQTNLLTKEKQSEIICLLRKAIVAADDADTLLCNTNLDKYTNGPLYTAKCLLNDVLETISNECVD